MERKAWRSYDIACSIADSPGGKNHSDGFLSEDSTKLEVWWPWPFCQSLHEPEEEVDNNQAEQRTDRFMRS